jgi:hypothetical protein
MALARPKRTTRRGADRNAGGGGGGGSTNEYKDWISLPLDPNNGWTITTGSGAAAIGATVAKVGNQMHFKAPSAVGMICQGASMKGIFMARSVHIKPWADAGIAKPANMTVNQFEPESMQLKIEVEFSTSNGGPISGGDVVGAEGTHLTCLAGLAGFATDQGGNPNWASGVIWSAAQVVKYYGGEPSTSTNANLYRAGYKSYWTNAGVQGGHKWKNMADGGGAGAHNSIVYATSPLRKESDTLYGRSNIQAGSYDNTTAFGPMGTLGQQLFDNSTKFSDQALTPYWHLFLAFGTNTNTGGKGEIRIEKIRYYLQPVQNRAAL